MTLKNTLTCAAAATAMSAAGIAAALSFAGAAQATEGPGDSPIDAWSNYEWCPGDPIPQSDNPLPFATDSCHFWHYQSIRDGAPTVWWIVEGIQPSQCPPFAYMCP